MNKPFYDDSAHLAEAFQFIDDLTSQTARLAIAKINSYKLAISGATASASREELTDIIKTTLLNYTLPVNILGDVGFYEAECDN
jgi:hypothetical protein